MRQWEPFATGTTVNEVNLVEHTPRGGVLWNGSTTVRVRPWQHDPSRAFLLISGSHGPTLRLPDPSVVQEWLDRLVDWGYRSVRTSALSPEPSATFTDLGFTSVQDLSLLSTVHDATKIHGRAPEPGVHVVRRIPGRRHSSRITRTLLQLDRSAFGDEWCLDEDMFDESRTATRRSRLFVAGNQMQPDGFVVVGATGSTGFVQRLAVAPHAQRRGVATRLVASALLWAARAGCGQSIVNTATTNEPALDLYRSFGFQPMDHGLTVMKKTLA